MESAQTNSAALTTALAFHYQAMVGIEKCFDLHEGESIWFEHDGDVTFHSDSVDRSAQVEVKNYADALTDHHENFWKTLKNWLDTTNFKHESYSALVLHTTQKYGPTTKLIKWNSMNSDQRFELLEEIFKTRKKEELEVEPKSMKPIVRLQKEVMELEVERLKSVLGKVVLFTEADDLQTTENKVRKHLVGIPNNNQASYLHGLVGFVYSSASTLEWEISAKDFKNKCVELTTIYCKKGFTMPSFSGREASKDELEDFSDSEFVKKIREIEYSEVLPEAVGNWIELHNSLNFELDGAPQYREATNRYQDQIVKRFQSKHSTKSRNSTNELNDAKDLYDEVIGEAAPSTEWSSSPPLEYKNGLVHDAMDDEDREIRWGIKS